MSNLSSLQRAPHNPILRPNPKHDWESDSVFNAAAIYIEGRVHLLYRAVGYRGLSVLGYASSSDGIHIDERLPYPVYVAWDRQSHAWSNAFHGMQALTPFQYGSGGSWRGCEDPRLVLIDRMIYMTYTAFDGFNPPAVAVTAIRVEDFIQKKWRWHSPKLISPPGEMHKNWTIFPEKIKNKYAVLHSITPEVLVDYVDDFEFEKNDYINSHYHPNEGGDRWDNWIRGVGPPPIRTEKGWLVFYHAMDRKDPGRYKIGAKILDIEEPTQVLYRSKHVLLQPDADYENHGFKSGVVYTCGAVVIEETLLVYYGGADTVVCVASVHLPTLLAQMTSIEEDENVIADSPEFTSKKKIQDVTYDFI